MKLVVALLTASCIFTANAWADAAPKTPTYKLVATIPVKFGTVWGPDQYIIDTFDVDGDGADDFAISSMTKPPDDAFKKSATTRNFSGLPFEHSFLVRNLPAKHSFELIDLGDAGMSHRTWAGKFFRAPDGTVYFVLGRNGEIGFPNEIVGEHTAIFKIAPAAPEWTVTDAFDAASVNATASVSVCDIDADGKPDIFINNYNPTNSGSPPFDVPRFITLDGTTFSERDAAYSDLPGMVNRVDLNDVILADIDGDGRCDFLGASEIWGNGQPPISTSSYMLLNKGGHFASVPTFLPNPPFGSHQSGYELGADTIDGKVVVALASSGIDPKTSFESGFAFQLFSYADGSFTEVTNQLIKGKMASDYAGREDVAFLDIDGDGHDDIYLRHQNGKQGLQIYLWRDGKFVLTKIPVPMPQWSTAIAFLRSPDHACADLALLDQTGKLRRYECK